MTPATTQQPAGPGPSPVQRAAVREWATLTLGVLLVSAVLLGIVLVIFSRQRRLLAARSARRKKRKGAKTDAWAEAGRRVRVKGGSGPDDDTVDIDPEDLSPDDVDGPNKDGPRGPYQ